MRGMKILASLVLASWVALLFVLFILLGEWFGPTVAIVWGFAALMIEFAVIAAFDRHLTVVT
jgi:hypothetical protein